MSDLTPSQTDLLRAARAAREKAYAPYSGFPVGAALRLRDGRVFTGVNVENASLGLTICAERVALFATLTAVGHEAMIVEAIAVDAGAAKPASPCGACRQVMAELAPQAVVIWSDGVAAHVTPVTALLPSAFRLDRR
jgi:homotetrameric cytidine deaminase